MDYIKRINLSLDIRREQDREVYEILISQKQKTAYIIEKILNFERREYKQIQKNTIKEAFKEVLEEINFDINNKKTDNKDVIPMDVFDIFDNM